jgi:hypothetical protein
VQQPPNCNIVTGKWIFRHKFNVDGSFVASPSSPESTMTRLLAQWSSLLWSGQSSPWRFLAAGRSTNLM